MVNEESRAGKGEPLVIVFHSSFIIHPWNHGGRQVDHWD